ncbi:MAG: type III pantothenate kinase [Elusimicrobiota bacterium]|jgi:type III pantothenate kinase
MILVLDVGNSHIYGGLFKGEEIVLRFRRSSKAGSTSDEFGVFLRGVLRENGFDPKDVRETAICTVAPEVLHSLRNACVKYFGRPPFVLQSGVKTGLKILYKNPSEVGADRIANAVAATQLFPDTDLLIVDFGTATTFCAVNSRREYLGGVILAGLGISMEALEARTSKLPTVEILRPKQCLGRATVESIQSGLYFGAIGAVKEVCARISAECFAGRKPKIVGTGGFASLFADAGILDEQSPDLVLRGTYLALRMNEDALSASVR